LLPQYIQNFFLSSLSATIHDLLYCSIVLKALLHWMHSYHTSVDEISNLKPPSHPQRIQGPNLFVMLYTSYTFMYCCYQELNSAVRASIDFFRNDISNFLPTERTPHVCFILMRHITSSLLPLPWTACLVDPVVLATLELRGI
jgi:hypothetical protein